MFKDAGIGSKDIDELFGGLGAALNDKGYSFRNRYILAVTVFLR